MEKFRKGNRVAWRSQAGGYVVTKIGTVVQVVTPGYTPSLLTLPLRLIDSRVMYDLNSRGRPHRSYLVAVEVKGRRPRLYWPRAGHLERV